MLNKIAQSINTLSAFCGKRDVPALTQNHLSTFFDAEQADVMVLFGGSILVGADVLAQAMKSRAAKNMSSLAARGTPPSRFATPPMRCTRILRPTVCTRPRSFQACCSAAMA